MAASVVRLPSDWTRQPRFPTQSALLHARQEEKRVLSLALRTESPYFDRDFKHRETLFRDSFRKSGAFDMLPLSELERQEQELNRHPRARTTGAPTRSALFDQRATAKHIASLKFEPLEIERLKDIPKTPDLRGWWRLVDGYVEDPSQLIKESVRMQRAFRSQQIGAPDPAKERSAASVEDRKLLQEKKARLAPKVNHVIHAIPSDYQGQERVEQPRATDLVVRTSSMSENRTSFTEIPQLQVSPIRTGRNKKISKHNRRNIETLVSESANQRMLLDHIKTLSPHDRHTGSRDHLGGDSLTLGASDSSSTLPVFRRSCDPSIRCGGFA